MNEKYVIRHLGGYSHFWDDDHNFWTTLEYASIFEKIENRYYSPSGEQLLPEYGVWEKLKNLNESGIS